MMESLKDKILIERLPEHIAVIMDGNGRWAKQQGKMRIFGHQHGVDAVRNTTEACAELGVKYLTLYAFSTENWNRSSFIFFRLLHQSSTVRYAGKNRSVFLLNIC